MTMRTPIAGLAGLTTLLALVPAARAGDPPAHTAAMVRAARQVASEPDFATGVGAPRRDGVPLEGKFLIPIDGNDACAYPRDEAFGAGCSYEGWSGYAVNEPDNWNCTDSRMPEAMNAVNSSLAPVQTSIANALSAVTSEVAMACNWNHFTRNPMIPASANSDNQAAMRTVLDWADELLTKIEEEGGTTEADCGPATWEKYYRRVANAIHYLQDAQSEHHADGNLACGFNSEMVPVFRRDSVLFDFRERFGCAVFLDQTLAGSVGLDPPIWCDTAVVEERRRPDQPVALNSNMRMVLAGCSSLSLACMGLERTLRHHCRVNPAKTLACDGVPNDHSAATSNETWCEGEIHPAPGGQDFVGQAAAASANTLREAAMRWAEVCKEPDDPCDPDQCDAWCERSLGRQVEGRAMAGFCLNETPDPACVLHECRCAYEDTCGVLDGPCCREGSACQGEDLECDGATGTCVAADDVMCEAGLKNGDFSEGLAYWSVGHISGGNVFVGASVSYGCLPSQEGNQYVLLDVWGSQDAYVSQAFQMPAGASTLRMRLWNNLDAVTARISLFQGDDETVLDELVPPSLQMLDDPSDLYSVVCTGSSPVERSYDVSAFAGRRVELRLRGIGSSGYNGTIASFDDVVIE